MKLTKYEKSLVKAIQDKDFEIVPSSKKVRTTYREAAKATLIKDKRITIRLNGLDLDGIKELAIKTGKRYQTYISEILHKHVSKKKRAA